MKLKSILMESYNFGGWMTPNGDYTESAIHIGDILNYPSKFGLTSDFIDKVYARHGEAKVSAGRPTEGEAREELILLVLKNGWVRFRRYKQYWSVNLYKLDSIMMRKLSKWCAKMISDGLMKQHDYLKISDFATDELHEAIVSDILKGRLD